MDNFQPFQSIKILTEHDPFLSQKYFILYEFFVDVIKIYTNINALVYCYLVYIYSSFLK